MYEEDGGQSSFSPYSPFSPRELPPFSSSELNAAFITCSLWRNLLFANKRKGARAIVLLNFLPEEGHMSLEILPVVVQLKNQKTYRRSDDVSRTKPGR